MGDFWVFSATNTVPRFIYALIQSDKYQKVANDTAGTKMPRSDWNKVSNSTFMISNKLQEQKAIGSLFKNIDELIALQQRKIDTLKLLKKALQQHIFPEKGKDIPRVRFANFTDEWEQRKLGELIIKNNHKNKDLTVTNVESVSNKTGFTRQTDQFEDYSVASADLSNYYVIKPMQFAYNPSRINVGSIAYKGKEDDVSIVSPLYVSFSTTNDLKDGYLWYWFKSSLFERQREKLSEGGVRDTLSFAQLSEMILLFSNIDEQTQIGKILKLIQIDIDRNVKNLNIKKSLKQSFFQKMFI